MCSFLFSDPASSVHPIAVDASQSDDFGFFFEDFDQSVLQYKEYLVRTPKRIVKKRKSVHPAKKAAVVVVSDSDSD